MTPPVSGSHRGTSTGLSGTGPPAVDRVSHMSSPGWVTSQNSLFSKLAQQESTFASGDNRQRWELHPRLRLCRFSGVPRPLGLHFCLRSFPRAFRCLGLRSNATSSGPFPGVATESHAPPGSPRPVRLPLAPTAGI